MNKAQSSPEKIADFSRKIIKVKIRRKMKYYDIFIIFIVIQLLL